MVSIVCVLALAYLAFWLTRSETVVRIGTTSTIELSSGILASSLATMRPLLKAVKKFLSAVGSPFPSSNGRTRSNSRLENESNDGLSEHGNKLQVSLV
jgi:hypothetical protein